MNKICYSTLTIEDIPEAYSLVRKVYDEFVSNENNTQGNSIFYDFIKPEKAQKRLSEISFAIVAKVNTRICGIIEVKNNNHICLLFVKKNLHKHGIAKAMFKLAIDKCIQNKRNYIDVNSSLYAVPIYKKLGFRKTENRKLINGIQFVPMLYSMNKNS